MQFFCLFLLHPVQRRLGDIHLTLFDQLRHEPKEESQHQRPDMSAIHIRIRHNNDLIISKFRDVKILMNSRTKGRDHGTDLVIT